MDEQLAELCETHDFNTISIMWRPNGKVTVFPHWDDEQGTDTCCSGHGKTFMDAFNDALSQANGQRSSYDQD